MKMISRCRTFEFAPMFNKISLLDYLRILSKGNQGAPNDELLVHLFRYCHFEWRPDMLGSPFEVSGTWSCSTKTGPSAQLVQAD